VRGCECVIIGHETYQTILGGELDDDHLDWRVWGFGGLGVCGVGLREGRGEQRNEASEGGGCVLLSALMSR